MLALVFANGDLNPGPLVDRALAAADEASLWVAADGGALHAEALGAPIQTVIGDMDSLTEADLIRLEARGATLRRFSPAKDETDLELALLYVIERGADSVRVIGALGGRLDQTLANVLLLTRPELAGRDIRLVAGRQAAWLLTPGAHPIEGRPGDTLSLVPLGGDAGGVATDGLQYPLHEETLAFGPARGVSNVFVGAQATVRLESGLLLAIHTLGRA
jgi:thiamine pyrophosphokinase